MSRLYASIKKEILLLIRDRAGLFFLFVLPAFLVLVITLIQQNVLKTEIKILYMDNDGGRIGQAFETLLMRSDAITLVKMKEGVLTQEDAQDAVGRGDFPFCIIIPKGLGQGLERQIADMVKQVLFGKAPPPGAGDVPEILMFFDPTTHGSYRSVIRNSIRWVLHGIEQDLKMKQLLRFMPYKVRQSLPPGVRASFPLDAKGFSLDVQGVFKDTILRTRSEFSTRMGFVEKPTPVQQNVPAWTIFGIFFIALPISGSLIKERQSGTLMRLKSMPVSPLSILSGKVVTYGGVGFGQFALIWAIGCYILPLFGADAFDIGPKPLIFFTVLLSTICCATGYGIFLGIFLKSHEQASLFGPVSIVIASALSGIMVPVYAMPSFLQPVGMLFPLYWSQNAFYDILLRAGGWASVLPEVAANFLFFFFCIFFASIYMFKEGFYTARS